MSTTYQLVNAHLEGTPFFWEGGPVGVLLSHGYTATAAEVRPLAQMLHAAGYTVAGPLLPGHGTEPEDLNATTWQDWAAAYERVYDRLRDKCAKVVLGGESLGGLLTLHAAIYHPEAAAVLCYAPALRTTSLPMRLFAELIKRWVPMRPKPLEPDGASALWQGYDQNPVAAATQLFRLQVQVDRYLSDIRQPLLIVQGKKDKSVYPDVPDWIAEQVSSEEVEVHWMENSGHCVILDVERAAVGEITLRFLKKYVG
jgi:carboxylesterase